MKTHLTTEENNALLAALAPLVAIADAYDANELDDEARKFWGRNDEHQNESAPSQIKLYAGRDGRQFLNLRHCNSARRAVQTGEDVILAIVPLVEIANAYDADDLGDEARRFFGRRENTTAPEHIELYAGRGGRKLLTLAHAFAARNAWNAALYEAA